MDSRDLAAYLKNEKGKIQNSRKPTPAYFGKLPLRGRYANSTGLPRGEPDTPTPSNSPSIQNPKSKTPRFPLPPQGGHPGPPLRHLPHPIQFPFNPKSKIQNSPSSHSLARADTQVRPYTPIHPTASIQNPKFSQTHPCLLRQVAPPGPLREQHRPPKRGTGHPYPPGSRSAPTTHPPYGFNPKFKIQNSKFKIQNSPSSHSPARADTQVHPYTPIHPALREAAPRLPPIHPTASIQNPKSKNTPPPHFPISPSPHLPGQIPHQCLPFGKPLRVYITSSGPN